MNSLKCRICLKEYKENMKLLTTLCDDNKIENLKFSDMLNFIIGNGIDQGRELDSLASNINQPDVLFKICEHCEKKLIASYLFKKMCINAEEFYKNIISCNIVEETRTDYDDTIENNFYEYEHQEEEIVNNENDTIEWEDKTTNEIENNTVIDNDNNILKYSKIPIKPQIKIESNIINRIEDQSVDTKIENVQLHTKNKKNYTENFGQCRLCNLSFPNLKEYKLHHRQYHRVRVRALCPFCGIFVSTQTMAKHIVSHTKAKKFLCTECGKNFTLIENLKKHLRIHTGDKRYTCEYCEEKFIHWNSKRSHIRATHTGEKRYECKICGKLFAQSSNMFRHVRQHTGELPHECKYCKKKFMTTSELKNHLVVHTQEKNENCVVCSKSFGTKKALKAHFKIHTGERNYVCTICKKAFTQAHVLRSHMKTHPDYPIPPRGTILSQKALNRPPKLKLLKIEMP